MNLVLITRFKGGPGSGHFGHAGRPGLRGGSLPGNVAMSVRTGMAAAMRKGWVPEPKEALESAESSKSSAKGPRVVDTYDKIQGTRMGKGYFITRDGKLIDISDEFGGGTNDHVGMFVMESSPELLGIDKKVAARYSEATKKLMGPDYTEWNEEYESEWMEALMDTWNSVYNAKNARVRIFGNNVYIQGNVGLRDVQDYMLDLKLPSGKGYKYTLETSDGDLRFSDVPYERLVEAEKLSQLKEKAAGKTITLKAKGNRRKKWVITIEDEYNDDWIRKLPDYDDVEVTEAAMDLRSSSVGED